MRLLEEVGPDLERAQLVRSAAVPVLDLRLPLVEPPPRLPARRQDELAVEPGSAWMDVLRT